MDNLKKLGNSISIKIPPDSDRFTGRECPAPECKSYFKVEFGTGLNGTNVPCHCPYCGHTSSHDDFWTEEQIEYAKSMAFKKIDESLRKDLKSLEFDIKPKGLFGIGISLKLQDGKPIPIRHYREKQLETIIVCDACTLRYAIYGVFGYCPDCGIHNSLQIFIKSLELLKKQLALAGSVESDLSSQLIEDALENAVSAFDGFGRELCRVNAHKTKAPTSSLSISFQSIESARKRIFELFAYDLSSCIHPDEWSLVCRCFQKRHILAHKMGVADTQYVTATKDPLAVVGRRIVIQVDEVEALAKYLEIVANGLSTQIK